MVGGLVQRSLDSFSEEKGHLRNKKAEVRFQNNVGFHPRLFREAAAVTRFAGSLRNDDRLQDLLVIYEFYKEYYRRIEVEMRSREKWTEPCPECELPAFDLFTGVCEVCGHVEALE